MNADSLQDQRAFMEYHVDQNARNQMSRLQNLVLGNPHLNQTVCSYYPSKEARRIVAGVLAI